MTKKQWNTVIKKARKVVKDYCEILELDLNGVKEEYFSNTYKKGFINIKEVYEALSYEKQETFEKLALEIKEEDIQGTIKSLEKLIKEYPASKLVKVVLGNAYLINENKGKALKMFSELNEAEPCNKVFTGCLAKAYLNRGWHKKAIEAYKKALKLDENSVEFKIGLADAYVADNAYSNAEETLSSALEQDKYSIVIYAKMALLNLLTDKALKVVEYTEKLKEIALTNEGIKNDVELTLSHISSYLNTKEEDELKFSKKAVKEESIEPEKNYRSNAMEYVSDFDRCFGYYNEEDALKSPYVRKEVKIGRNAPCICGSGKKYKKCCGK